jgi:Arc-like DNA binding domain
MNPKKRKYKPVQAAPFGLRMPRDIKNWLEKQAKRNASSQNSEIVRALREAMDSASREARASAAS